LKLPAIELPASLGKIPGLSRFVKAKDGAAGAAHGASGAKGGAKGHGAGAPSHEQQVIGRLDLTQKGFAVLAIVLILLALYTVFSQNGLNKAILTAAPPTIDLAELAAAGPESGADEPAEGAKAAKAAKPSASARVKLPEGTDARLDFAFEQIANFENTRSEAILRDSRATVAGVAPGSPAARAGFIPGDYILGVDGEQAGFVWDSLRKLTAAGKSSVLIEVQRGPEVLRGELFAPEGELLTSGNSGLFFQIPEGYRFVGENDRRDLRTAFTRSYLEGLAGDERLAYATSLAILGANLMKRGVAQTKLRPDDSNWLKTELILSDHHNKFNKVLTHHTAQIEGMQAQLQSGFVKVGAYLLASLLAAVAALAAALQHQRHLAEHHAAQVRAQFQGLRAEVDHWMHSQKTAAELAASSPRGSDGTGRAGDAPIVTPVAAGPYNAGVPSAGALSSGPSPARPSPTGLSPSGPSPAGPPPAGPSPSGPSPVAALSLAELAARVALGGDGDEEKPRARSALPEDLRGPRVDSPAGGTSNGADARAPEAGPGGPSNLEGDLGTIDAGSSIGADTSTDAGSSAHAGSSTESGSSEPMGSAAQSGAFTGMAASTELSGSTGKQSADETLLSDPTGTGVERTANASRTGDGAST